MLPVRRGFHARFKLDHKFVQFRRRSVAARVAEVGDGRIVRVAVIIGEVAQRPIHRRADHAALRPDPQDRDFHLRHHRLILIFRAVVAQRLHIDIIAPVRSVGSDHLRLLTTR